MRPAVFAILFFLLPFSPCLPADAEKDFNELFGQDLERVAATGEKKDDAELAAVLLNAAGRVGERPELQALILVKAYELGIQDPSGYEAAEKALQKSMSAAPGKGGELQEKLLNLRELQYRNARGKERMKMADGYVQQLVVSGDLKFAAREYPEALSLYRKALIVDRTYGGIRKRALSQKKEAAGQRVEAERRIESLQKKLDLDPENKAVREDLILSCLLDLDDPAGATRYLDPRCGELFRKNIPLAAKPVEEVPEAVCLQLASWYSEFGEEENSRSARALAAWRRAAGYYRQYLAVHQRDDIHQLRANLALGEIQKKLAKQEGIQEKPPRTYGPLEVSVKEPWPLSFKVKRGQILEITAEGRWRVRRGGRWRGPDDSGFFLRGRIGGGKIFKVGSRYTLEILADGVLHLGMNEGGTYANNSGKITVTIQVTE